MSYGYTLLAESFPVAQKRHRCIWCGEAILPGEKYRRERSVYDGNMQNFAWHPECDEAFKAELDAGGECEFSAYDNDRPGTCDDCGGSGHTGELWPGHEFQPPEPERCPSCQGSGRVPIPHDPTRTP